MITNPDKDPTLKHVTIAVIFGWIGFICVVIYHVLHHA